jgi:uncharacterized membrane protein
MSAAAVRQRVRLIANGLGATLLFLLALWVTVYALYVYAALPMGNAVAPGMRQPFRDNALAVYLHVFGASIAPVIGLVQLSGRLRRRWPQLHRWLGRYYLVVCVLIGGVAGLWLGLHAYGGWSTRAAFIVAALLWLASGQLAFLAIRKGDVTGHSEWMLRNVAMSLGAVTLRLNMALAQVVLGFTFDQSYPFIAWLSFTPNLLVAEWLLRRRRARTRTPSHSHHRVQPAPM